MAAKSSGFAAGNYCFRRGYLLVAVDPNDFKPEIKSAAASQGLELSLDGNLSWQFLPQIGVVVEQVEFAHSTVASGKIRRVITVGELERTV